MTSRAPCSVMEKPVRPQRPRDTAASSPSAELAASLIPPDRDHLELALEGGATLRLTDLRRVLWPELGLTRGDLLRYYASVAPVLLPHLRDRAMVMRCYPNGVAGGFFFMKRAPETRPSQVRICSIQHGSGTVLDFTVIQDLPSLLWLINLGGIELNPGYSRCDDLNRPDTLNFDLDPTPGATFKDVLEAAVIIRCALDELGMPSFVKTTGSRGVHIHVPIVRGPTQKKVWTFAKALANILALRQPRLLTAEYRVAERPKHHVLIDYNQNAWGRTLVSLYSVRPTAAATVSTPVTWSEVERGFTMEEHRLETLPSRLDRLGDLWAPLLNPAPRVKLDDIV